MTQADALQSNSFWIDENLEFINSVLEHSNIIPSETIPNDSEYDVIVIGTGLSGAACAYWLRKLYPVERFPRIALLEKNSRPCTGASGRNGGFLWPSYDYLAGYVEDFGYENGCRWVEFQHENVRAVAQAVKENNIDCDLNLTRGNVGLARTEEELELITKSHEIIKDYLSKQPKTKMTLDNLELWDHEKCRQMLHSDKFIGGLFMRESGTVWVSKLVYGILKYCLSQPGVDIITNAQVIRVENSTNIVLANGQVIRASQGIVHATNAYAGSYVEFLRDKVVPTRNQCIRTKPIDTIFWPFGLSARDGREYFHQSPTDGRIILGGCRWRSPDTEYNNDDDTQINALIREEHENYFAKWFPGIAEKNCKVEVEQCWSGIMGFTSDHLPLIGPLPGDDKQYLLCGYNGNGMPNGFLCAKAVARMIAKDDPHKEGDENNTVTFLNMFLPERFTKSKTE